MRKLVIVICIAVLMLAAAGPALADQGGWKDRVYIGPWSGTVSIGPGEEPVLRLGWSACSEGLTSDFIDVAVHNIVIVKDAIPVGTYSTGDGEFSKPAVFGSSDACLHGDGTTWVTWWNLDDLGVDDPGTYEVQWEFYVEWPIVDGGDWDGNGYVDVWDEHRDWFVEIEVYE